MGATTRSRRRILIVDDDRALRHALAALLAEAGHVVEQAGDGPEAVARLDQGGFDIALLDINLPSVSGLDILAHARRAEAPPIVIMMTADDTPATLLSAVRGQAYRYLRKPFAPVAIVEVIDEALLGWFGSHGAPLVPGAGASIQRAHSTSRTVPEHSHSARGGRASLASLPLVGAAGVAGTRRQLGSAPAALVQLQ